MKKTQKRAAPLAAEDGVIGDTVQIGKNAYGSYDMFFQSKWLTKAEKKFLLENLSTKMKSRPEGVQTLYQINIDFVNKKLNKENYIDKLDCLLMSPQSKGFGCELDEGERIFVGGYSIFFDLYGADVDAITKKDILSYMAYLLP